MIGVCVLSGKACVANNTFCDFYGHGYIPVKNRDCIHYKAERVKQ
jgi:hypothetical protein